MPQGWTLRHFDVLGSTNDTLKRLCTDHPDLVREGTAVTAGRQTGGRGRRNRPWRSPEGNLYLSVLLSGKVPGSVTTLSFAAALAVAQTVRRALPETVRVACKWPNDVLAGGGKTSGILFEDAGPAAPGYLVAGIGINVVPTPVENALYPITSLTELGGTLSAAELAPILCSALHGALDLLRTQGFAALRDRWLALAGGIGEPVTVRLENEDLHGRFAGIAEDGALRLALASGTEELIYAGDVFLSGAST